MNSNLSLVRDRWVGKVFVDGALGYETCQHHYMEAIRSCMVVCGVYWIGRNLWSDDCVSFALGGHHYTIAISVL